MNESIGTRFGSIATHQLYAIRGAAKIYAVDEVVFVKKVLGEKVTYLRQLADLCHDDAVKVLEYVRNLMPEGELVKTIESLDQRLRYLESLHEPPSGPKGGYLA